MTSSRIFVKGLPPNISENEFRKHFSTISAVKDARIYSNRRIGFVGYDTAEDAQRAVKHFHKTFIRMSRLSVEIARPPRDSNALEQENESRSAGHLASANVKSDPDARRKRKREDDTQDAEDPKLKEFLEVVGPKSKKKAWEKDVFTVDAASVVPPEVTGEEESDEEYQTIQKKAKVSKTVPRASRIEAVQEAQPEAPAADPEEPSSSTPVDVGIGGQPAVSDSDWARSKTSRLLGLLDDGEDEGGPPQRGDAAEDSPSDDDLEGTPMKGVSKQEQKATAETSIPTPPSDGLDDDAQDASTDKNINDVRSSMRLFVRNLPYDVKEEDLESEFESFGNLEEVHVAIDKKSGTAKGFAFVQFSNADSAENAMREKDGQTFSGRLIHILPASAKQDNKLDDFALSKLPLKQQQQIKKRREATTKTFNWNALYMNADAVVSSVADRLGLSKSEVLDPTSSDAAVRQAHAETHVIQETKTFFKQHGVDLDAFKKKQRGDTAILAKNIPYDCSQDELKRRFEEYGELKRFLMPPSRTVAIVEFANRAQCQTAFSALAYRRIKSSMLFLEKAPKGLFDAPTSGEAEERAPDNTTKASVSDLRESAAAPSDTAGRSTLYVRNLNFKTTTAQLSEAFQPLEGFLSAIVKTKTDPKQPNVVLSMGFGFIEFRDAQQAQKAIQIMDGQELDGHKLQIRSSHKGADAAEQRRVADAEKRAAGKKTKIVIKNLPFEATKKDVRALFGPYGQLRSVRVPKKMDRATRGFAFADFLTPKEAESAMEALRHTHLLGRRLVLDFAAEEPEDAEAEIEKMQQKVGAQMNTVALRKLTSGGRKKFSTQNDDEEEA